MSLDNAIPALLSIDVEPDRLRLPRRGGPISWSGWEAMPAFAEWLRDALVDQGSEAPHFGWYFRMDPQIEAVHGTPDFGVTSYSGTVARLVAQGDHLGVHVHPLRWSDHEGSWLHDFADASWIEHCVESAFEAFRGVFGESPRRHRFGAGFLSNELVAVLERLGVRVDLTMEPGCSASRPAGREVPMRGRYPDLTRVPREPYRPDHDDYRRRSDEGGRDVVLVPQASHTRRDKSQLWRAARFVRRGFRTRALPLPPWGPWPSPRYYWDLMASEIDAMPHPYLALAIRTDAPDSETGARVRELVEYLPRHELARRLHFVDPLELTPTGRRSDVVRASCRPD